MMRFGIVTLFPEMFSIMTDYGVVGRANEQGLIQILTWNPRQFAYDKHKTVDDRPYGGGPGMVLMAQPMKSAIQEACQTMGSRVRVIHLTPQGRRLDQESILQLKKHEKMLLVCGRYEGIDERVIDSEIDEEWSIGDYVLSGGELAAMVIIDSITRTLEGVLGHEDSAPEDSFFNGLLDYPHYTRPEIVDGQKIPDILLSGDHERIKRWRQQQALGRTWLRRPDLLNRLKLNSYETELLEEFKQLHKTDQNEI